ncbi:sodium:proton antiporter [Clostridium sp. AF27-2AA]|uniref:sodium:proton antiporter n=1 Tax=Clostridium sp. AF27-2AA TaxID=2292206 RepID=UPI001FA96DD8|nr:sodium:proton antiporter [Clostridium sp. AF27-2AA]
MMMNLAFCIPFAGLLLCIAMLPLVKAEWWEAHQPHAVVFWSLLFVLPFAFVYGPGQAFEKVLECIVDDYLTFIILLFGLFCVSGNITLEGDLAGSPRINVGLLLIGTMLSSWIGTTGASMLMVRPIIKMNAWRKRRSHIMVFFIFLISNIGGCLTPIGDPPLLMGFMRGVPFFWSLHLFPVLLFNVVILLTIFYFLDRRAYRKDIAEGLKPDISKPGTEVHILGLHNLIFLAMIVAAVILSGTLPGMAAFQDAEGAVRGIHLFGEVTLTYPALIEVVIILVAAFLSFKTTSVEIRRKNHFTWGAIQEVAVLFVGIFITMQPALMILKANGASLGLNKPFEMFWATGCLSSFLDNTPTYLVFLTTAGALGFTEGMPTILGTVPIAMLEAISCGAVFMGANTYIGNAPNFMVKSISDENGIRMPSFFGYLLWSITFLIPVFLLDMLVFFL